MTDMPDSGAIEARGEISISLDGVAHVLRPSFEAIGAIETATGKTLFELAQAAETGKITLAQAGAVVAHCMRAHARSEEGNPLHTDVQPASIAERIYTADGGLLMATRVVIYPLLFGAIMGGYTALGKPKPRTTTK